MKRTLRMRVDGQEFTVDVERTGNTLSVERDGEHYTVELLDTQTMTGEPHTSGQQGATGSTGATVPPSAASASPAAATPPVSIPQSPADSSQTGAGGAVAAPMTGVVKEVLVGPGDTVSAGERIVIMEAMKMDIEVSAPSSGTVAEVLIKAGENVKEQQSLLRISGDA